MSDRQGLLDVFRHAGTHQATIKVPTPSDRADAKQRFDIRHANILKLLEEHEVPPALASLVDRALLDRQHDDASGLVMVATDDEILLDASARRSPLRADVSIGPTPRLLTELAATRTEIGHAAVLVDRVGADIWFRTGVDRTEATTTVDGEELHVHRGHPGGWSQQRFQQRAENTWESNARQAVAEVVDFLPREVEVIVVAGDVRALGFFIDHVPSRLLVLPAEGSRSADRDAFLDDVDAEIRTLAANRLTEDLDAVQAAIATGDGVQGVDALDALGQGRVDKLFVVDDSDDTDRSMTTFDFSVPLAITDGSVSGDHVVEASTTEGAVALAVARGSDVVVLPSTGVAGLDRSLAAVLR